MRQIKLVTAGADADGWLRQALGRAAQLDEARLVLTAQPPSPRRSFRRGSRWTGGMHRHVYPEMAINLHGPAILDVEDDRHDLSAGRCAVLEPGVLHSEGYAQVGQPYAMFWLIGALPLGIGLVSRYRPRMGWDCPLRVTFRTARTLRLFERFIEPAARMSVPWLDSVRAELVGLLAEVHEAVYTRQQGLSEPAAPPAQHVDLLNELRGWLDQHLDQQITVNDLASMTRLSPNHLNHLFAAAHGEPIRGYLLRQRMKKALHLLRETDLLVKEVARRVGYSDPLYFSRAFGKYHGRTARSVREGRPAPMDG
jgi:AraC-like DNA-binding protein